MSIILVIIGINYLYGLSNRNKALEEIRFPYENELIEQCKNNGGIPIINYTYTGFYNENKLVLERCDFIPK